MKNQKLIYLGAGLTVIILAAVVTFFTMKPKHEVVTQTIPYNHTGPCPGETKTLKMDEPYMSGIIENGEEYKLISDFYWCNKVERGDLVLLLFAQGLDPVLRKIYAIPGDEFEVYYNKAQGAWNLKVNGDVVTHNKEPYFFGAKDPKSPPPLKLLEVSRKGVLLDREIILFTNTPPGVRDSGTLGVVNLNDVVGKVELIKK